jgi:hypothetical protein
MFEATYLSLEIGGINDFVNESVLDSAKHRIKKMWGERATHLIKPVFKNVLPGYWVASWLDGEATDRESDGSELVILFFMDDPYTRPMAEVLREKVSEVDWKSNCVNFRM